jgi:hypothetical protein
MFRELQTTIHSNPISVASRDGLLRPHPKFFTSFGKGSKFPLTMVPRQDLSQRFNLLNSRREHMVSPCRVHLHSQSLEAPYQHSIRSRE